MDKILSMFAPLWNTMIDTHHEIWKIKRFGYHFLFLDLQDIFIVIFVIILEAFDSNRKSWRLFL